ncbi:CLUMA_CG008732, isoform A [Clunio marinus]|uniref:CLUMA_CG008732, isoform A n=1 Tax=Clunio marinus TaxID=568069 RepID=A0A1J1I5F2_9DIPT|nr:CLUMA_CG008732, isoform A [Clunio marinus]
MRKNKSEINANRFKSQHFPFEYIPVDDLHYYRRRKPCNCSKSALSRIFWILIDHCFPFSFFSQLLTDLFQSHISLSSKPERSSTFNTEYKQNFYEKPCFGRLAPVKRPPNLKVDAYPFLTGTAYKSEPNLYNYQTEYETNFPIRSVSPRLVMDIFSEQKSQYKPYSEEIISRARPPMVKKPNNLYLTGEIELFPEYKSSYVPYTLDSIYKYNQPLCTHLKREKKVKKTKSPPKNISPPPPPQEDDMDEHYKPIEAKILNNNYGVPCMNRYHQKLDSENDYMPEYRRQYKPVVGKRSSLIPQPSNLTKFDDDDDFYGASEYTNRYKSYDHFTKSAPIKKQDNLHVVGFNDMRPEYKERYKEVDMNTFERRYPYRHQDNLHSEGEFGRQMPEYYEKYKNHQNAFPEKAKPRQDFLALNGEMQYSPEYRKNYVGFPRQRPIVKRPPTNIRMPSSHDRDRKPDKLDLPITLSYHETGSPRPVRTNSQEEEFPIEKRPEYRRAMHNYLIKERSPSRSVSPMPIEKKQTTPKDPNDVSQILMDNKVNVPEEKIFDDNNEVIVEPLKKPSNFKIPTRSPSRHAEGRGPSYPLQKDHRFNEHESMAAQKRLSGGRRSNLKVTIDDYDSQYRESVSFEDDDERQVQVTPPRKPSSHRKSPKFGRRASNQSEDYNIRGRTNVIEANPRYVQEKRNELLPNRHEQRAYFHKSNQHQIPMAQPPADSLANNYQPNYEINKQNNYRQSLKDDRTPFVVIDQQAKSNTVKPNTWMKKQWYDTQ